MNSFENSYLVNTHEHLQLIMKSISHVMIKSLLSRAFESGGSMKELINKFRDEFTYLIYLKGL